jgi:hypothetical protein
MQTRHFLQMPEKVALLALSLDTLKQVSLTAELD